ncbi:hypothetical protein [Luteolibacter marinus]|uniref:hypothetical protein n=1 Tax=Luteolibacter marinus TaxID=2776705 RepID=UPI001866C1B7|nr:hypothetical protein [Luteolibacter marinus]
MNWIRNNRRMIVAVASVAMWLLWPDAPPAPPTRDAAIVMKRATPRAPLRPAPRGITRLDVADQATVLNAPGYTVHDDIAFIEFLLSQYARHHQGNPVGDNREITAALLGANPRRLAYLPGRGPFLDRELRLIDRWGVPYFFHAISAHRMDVRSAGPDRTMWTSDDIVHQPGM